MTCSAEHGVHQEQGMLHPKEIVCFFAFLFLSFTDFSELSFTVKILSSEQTNISSINFIYTISDVPALQFPI